MDITIALTDTELHDLSNQVQIALWKVDLGQASPSLLVEIGKRVIAAAAATPKETSGSAAMEYVGKYFQAKASAEHLEVQNALLMKAVEGMARRAAIMQAALIEAGLSDKIPPPVRLLNAEPISQPA